jgi:hypothetical protein
MQVIFSENVQSTIHIDDGKINVVWPLNFRLSALSCQLIPQRDGRSTFF